MKILFINPINRHDLLGCPPAAFYTEAHLAARHVGRIPGCSVDFADFVDTTPGDVIKAIQPGGYALVGLMAAALNRFQVFELAEKIKKVSPQTKILVFGNFFGLFPEETLQRLPAVDFVASGDSAPAARELVEALMKRGDIADIEGLSYRQGGNLVIRGKRPPADLDDIIYTDNDFFKPTYPVLRPMPLWEEDRSKLCYPLLTSISCSNRCAYCHLQTIPYRSVSLEKTLSMFETIIEREGVRNFLLVDASLACNEKRLQDICRGLLDRRLGIKWACEIAPTVSPETLELMGKAGCISIHFALETGSERIHRIMRPKASVQQARAVGRKCAELGMRFAYFSLVSFPMEELSDVWQTVEVLRELAGKGGFSGMAPVFIMPKTRLEKIAISRGLLPRNFDWFDRNYRCKLAFVTPGSGEQTMPHPLEGLTERQIRYLLGFVLAVQDFAGANPRVANLRYDFLLRMSYLHGCFILDFLKKNRISEAVNVLGQAIIMFGQFWYWKARKFFPRLRRS